MSDLTPLKRMFGIDVRALAVMRVGLGILLLGDLFCRLGDLRAFYTDAGVMPRSASGSVSFYSISGEAWLPVVLFAVTGVAALLLTIGYHTWLATAACWILVVQLQQRNPNVLNGGDHVIVLLLFWSMFVPLGARASVDALRRNGAPRMILSVGSAALMLQIAMIYVFTALLKSVDAWLLDATAAYEALNLSAYSRPWTGLLLRYPALLELGSRATWLVELLLPLIAFLPVRSPIPRLLTGLTFIGFHIGLLFSFTLGVFPYVCIIAWVVYLPSEFWDRLLAHSPARRLSGVWSALIQWVAARIDRVSIRWPWLASPGVDWRGSTAGAVVAGAAVVFIFVWNLTSLGVGQRFSGLKQLGTVVYLTQEWSMFAPRPLLQEGWYVAPALLADGSEVDIYSGNAPIDWERPESLFTNYGSARWRKLLLERYRESTGRHRLPYFADWLRDRWDREHASERAVVEMRLIFMGELTRPDYLPPKLGQLELYRRSASGEERVVGIGGDPR